MMSLYHVTTSTSLLSFWLRDVDRKKKSIIDSYSRLTARRTSALPLAHLFVFLLHFTLTCTPGLGLWHCVCVRGCVFEKAAWCMFLPLLWKAIYQVELINQGGGMEMGMKTAAYMRVRGSLPELIPVDTGGVAISCRCCICFAWRQWYCLCPWHDRSLSFNPAWPAISSPHWD